MLNLKRTIILENIFDEQELNHMTCLQMTLTLH